MSESSSWAAHSASPIDVLFARLKPVNEAAKKAFHNVALTFVRNPDRAKSLGAAKYIHFDVSKDHAHDPINPDGIINNGSELWTGYFELCFDVPPANPHTGWTIGEGSSENNINAPDILIGTGEKLENESRSPLAILAHDQNSGALAMVVPNGKTVTLDSFEEIQGCKRLLHKAVTSIEIKSKSYKLEFQTMQNQDYRILLNGYRKSNINTSEELPSSLALVPSQFDNLIDQYVVKNAIGEGSTCTVYAGYDRTTGQVVAIKKYIRRDARSFERECGRVKMVARMDPHPGILQHVATIDPMEHDPTAGYTAFGLDEVYFIFQPLANWTLTQIIQDDAISTHVNQRLHILRQLLKALAFLHSYKIMHRDIKPDNIAIVSLKPPRACLIDFGHAIHGKEAADRNVGTLPWCAPEVGNAQRKYYSNKVDVFSLGLCMYQLFCEKGRVSWGKEFSYNHVDRAMSDIKALCVHESVKTLLKGMLELVPSVRLDAARASADMAKCFEDAIAEAEQRVHEQTSRFLGVTAANPVARDEGERRHEGSGEKENKAEDTTGGGKGDVLGGNNGVANAATVQPPDSWAALTRAAGVENVNLRTL